MSAKRVLNIVERGYRATLEEQDDPVLWLNTVLRDQGLDVHVLLRGAAVSYAVRTQDASGLEIGGVRQTQPPRLDDDLRRLASKGAIIHVLEEDLAARAIAKDELIVEVRLVGRAALPELLADHDHVWSW